MLNLDLVKDIIFEYKGQLSLRMSRETAEDLLDLSKLSAGRKYPISYEAQIIIDQSIEYGKLRIERPVSNG